MKRKVMLQFMIAMLIIGLMVSFINTTVVSYFMYATSEPAAAQKFMVNFSPDTFNIKEAGNIKFADGLPVINEAMLDALKKSGSFIQIIDSSGKEIKSINKPDFIKMDYRPEEMAKLIGSPEMVQYKLQNESNLNMSVKPEDGSKPGVVVISQDKPDIVFQAGQISALPTGQKSGSQAKQVSASPTEQKSGSQAGNVSALQAGKKSGSQIAKALPAKIIQRESLSSFIYNGSTISYDMFIQVPNGDLNSKIRMIVGIMRPNVNMKMFFYSFFKFITEWNPQKLFTTFLTVLVSLIMGYIFSRRMAKPVVKITNGIAQMAAGNYDAVYPEKGLYSEVYTSLNHMGKVLHQNEEERKRLEKMRSDWIANISHDLKTPLASIKGYGELLLEPDYNLTPEERKKYSEVIFNKSNYIEHLIDDLKLVQKLRNNLLPLKKTENNLVELLREIVISILNDPQYEDRSISFESRSEMISLSYDTVLLQRAFTNIIYNAILHNPADTRIHVTINTADGDNMSRIVVEINDNGRGIPEEDRKNLFERYYRGTSTDSLHAGSGLGLAIANEVIEAHGGNIDLESEVGTGTTIRVIFPMNQMIR